MKAFVNIVLVFIEVLEKLFYQIPLFNIQFASTLVT